MAGQDDVIGNLWYGNFKQMRGGMLFFIRRADCKESVSFAKKKTGSMFRKLHLFLLFSFQKKK